MHNDSIYIKAERTFLYSDSLSEAGEMEIVSRNSAIKIWLDKGLTEVPLSEKPGRNGNLKLFADSVRGSEDTNFYNYIFSPREEKTPEIRFNLPVSFTSEEQMHTYLDSLIRARKTFRDSLLRAKFVGEIDSVFEMRPDSKVLPSIIRSYNRYIGIDLMQAFYYRLSTTQQESKTGQDLLKELNKLQLLKPASFFGDFIMNDSQGEKKSPQLVEK